MIHLFVIFSSDLIYLVYLPGYFNPHAYMQQACDKFICLMKVTPAWGNVCHKNSVPTLTVHQALEFWGWECGQTLFLEMEWQLVAKSCQCRWLCSFGAKAGFWLDKTRSDADCTPHVVETGFKTSELSHDIK